MRPARTPNRPLPPRAAGAGAALAAAALWLAGCSPPPPAPEPVRSVRTVVVTDDAARAGQDFAAEVRARTESRLGFRVGGKLTARPAEVGQRVRAGQALARLDATDLTLGGEAAQAALQAAQAQLELQEAEFRRFQALRAQEFISAAELERRETALRAARAQVEQARAQAQVQRNQAAYGTLAATADGVVTAVEAEVGAVLAAGQPVLRLAHDGPRDAVFAVPEDRVAAVAALVGRPGALRVRGWTRADEVPATVREVAAAADPVTRTFLVRADLGGAPFQIGQTVTVRLEQPPMAGVHRLPLSAVAQVQGRTVVWLVDPATMTVRTQPVTVAGADGNNVVIAAGLAAGQRVVTAGAHLLQPGQAVRLYDIPSAEPPGAPPRAPRAQAGPGAAVAASAGPAPGPSGVAAAVLPGQ